MGTSQMHPLIKNSWNENLKYYLATPEHQTYVLFMGKNLPLCVGWFIFIQEASR
jgi:hypothetical protein